jgi:beta-ribofuranosylaminobenzene 5'-phosphate synthase
VIRVEAPSRLHFGLLSLCGPQGGAASWPDSEGHETIPARHFGGAGLMVQSPGIALTVAPAAEWSAQGACAARALTFAKAASAALSPGQAFEINIERCPPEHVGLGTGTQLGLAVARAIAVATGRGDISIPDLAKLVGRGRRSALGIHGFAQGGFLVEAGKHDPEAISPLVARLAFPEEWAVMLVIPQSLEGNYGPREAEAFQYLAGMLQNVSRTDALCRLLLLGMLPALLERDLEAFGAALYDFNRRVGEMFESVQGGVYAHPVVAKMIQGLRGAGVKAVGHSSWGPSVFAIVAAEQAPDLANWLGRQLGFQEDEIVVTHARNKGATL